MMTVFYSSFSDFPFSPKKQSEPFRSPEGKVLPSPFLVSQNVIISPEYPPSPKKHLLSPRGSDHPLSPRKHLPPDHFLSASRNIFSPTKSDFALSPRKVMSPSSRNENQIPSRNLLLSPGTMMSKLQLSSPGRIPLSPRKMNDNIMSSPGKGTLNLSSPVKSMDTLPVKSLFSSPYSQKKNTPSLKLEKQKGIVHI